MDDEDKCCEHWSFRCDRWMHGTSQQSIPHKTVRSRGHSLGGDMLRNVLVAACLLAGSAYSLDARADYWFRVADAGQIQYLSDGGTRIYLRNLNSFDSSVLGCCYNYWIDVSTDAGKAAWAALLSKIEAQEHIWLYLLGPQSQTVASLVVVGDWG
jgi:hypothetical protein